MSIALFIIELYFKQIVKQYFNDSFTECYCSDFSFNQDLLLNEIKVTIPRITGWIVTDQYSKVTIIIIIDDEMFVANT